jgi:hypothetical protein
LRCGRISYFGSCAALSNSEAPHDQGIQQLSAASPVLARLKMRRIRNRSEAERLPLLHELRAISIHKRVVEGQREAQCNLCFQIGIEIAPSETLAGLCDGKLYALRSRSPTAPPHRCRTMWCNSRNFGGVGDIGSREASIQFCVLLHSLGKLFVKYNTLELLGRPAST